MTKSQLMSVYNKARTAARQGKLDPARVNRAFGILQAKDAGAHLSKYGATVKSCTCIDHARTGKPCKHMIAQMIVTRAAPQKSILRIEAHIQTASPHDIKDWSDADFSRDVIKGGIELRAAFRKGYNPVKFECKRNYRSAGRWTGVYQITLEK